MSGLPIPDHVVAYAAGLQTGSQSTIEEVAGFLEHVFGHSFDPVTLQIEVYAWLTKHVTPEALHRLHRAMAEDTKK